MPGIVGIIGLDNSVHHLKNDFQSMMEALIYNQSDLFQVVNNNTYLLGVVNIKDRRNIPKCFTNHDGSVDALIDGDVFVSNDVRNRIAEKYQLLLTDHWQVFIPYLYQEYRKAFINYFKGWFNIVIIDKRENVHYLVNSRFGMRPLYYAICNGYFIFSSELKSIMQCSLIQKRLNEKAVIEYALFHYPLGDDTYIKDVFLMNPATLITIKGSDVMQHRYWKHESLFSSSLLPLKDSYEGAEAIFKKVVNEIDNDADRVGISLTGGFDGRTILSLINRNREDILLYSFGTADSGDIKVPQKIAQRLSYSYCPIYLNDHYASTLFNEYATKAILLSDGRSSLARAHYPYAFECLGKKITVALTGICGSELLRAISSVGAVIANSTKSLYTNGISHLESLLNCSVNLKYYNKNVTDGVKSSIIESAKKLLMDCEPGLSLNQKFYLFVVREIFRKYFGTELVMESPYLYNRPPYLDYDFVDFIFQTPLCGAHYDFFVQNPLIRIRGQQFYSYIIKRNSKLLSTINTSRMYSPHDLLTKNGKVKVTLTHYYRKLFEKEKDEYRLESGLKYFVENNSEVFEENEYLNTNNIMTDYENAHWRKSKLEFFKAISLAFWYHHTIR